MGFLVVPTINSALAAATAGFVAAVVVLPVAFSVVRRRTLVAEGASAAVTSVFALPGLVVALAVGFWAIQVPDPLAGLYQSFPLLIFAYVLHFGAQSMRSSQAAIAAVPERFDDAARTLGVSSRRRILEIDVPLIAPGLITGGGLVLLSTLKELPATLLLAPTGFETLATRIWGAAEDGFYAEVGISSLVLILLSALLTWFLILRPELTR
jgi:iron(III) transport system permease protein